MANDQFRAREAAYNDNLGQVVGRFATGIVEADSAAKDAHCRRVLNLIDKPNAEFSTESGLIGMEQKLETKMSVPAVVVTDMRPIAIEEATLEMDMTVSASNEKVDKLDSQSSGEGSGKIGWGPFSIGIKVKADVSVGKSHKRNSDYRSHTNAKLTMRQAPIPEGLALIIDAMNKNVAVAAQINGQIAEDQAGHITSDVEGVEALPEPETA